MISNTDVGKRASAQVRAAEEWMHAPWRQVRGFASGAAATANWVANMVVAQTFLALTRALGGSGTFWLYAAVAAAGAVWAHLSLPETKGARAETLNLRD